MEPEPMTRRGFEALLARKADLQRRIEDASHVAGVAAGEGHDWHDNPGYDGAVAEVQRLGQQLAELTRRLQRARIIGEPINHEVVRMGHHVTVQVDGRVRQYQIGGTADSNPREGIISNESPLGAALLGLKEGEETHYEAPTGKYRVRVVRIAGDRNDTE